MKEKWKKITTETICGVQTLKYWSFSEIILQVTLEFVISGFGDIPRCGCRLFSGRMEMPELISEEFVQRCDIREL